MNETPEERNQRLLGEKRLLQAENERLKAIAATVKTWVDEMEDYDANDYGLTPEEKDVMQAYRRVLALFSKSEQPS